MQALLPLILAVFAVMIMLHLPAKIDAHNLSTLFSDEEVGVVELRPDLRKRYGADECYRICTLRSYLTYAVIQDGDVSREWIEITYRGKPGPTLEVHDERIVRLGKLHSTDQKEEFTGREINDLRAFVNTVRVIISKHRAFA